LPGTVKVRPITYSATKLDYSSWRLCGQCSGIRGVRDIKVGLPPNPQQNCKNPNVRLRKTHLAATRRTGVVIGRVGLALRPSASGRRHPRIIRLRQQFHFHVAHPNPRSGVTRYDCSVPFLLLFSDQAVEFAKPPLSQRPMTPTARTAVGASAQIPTAKFQYRRPACNRSGFQRRSG
jgi:hypothetical protein